MEITDNHNKNEIIPKMFIKENFKTKEEEEIKNLQNNLDLITDYLKNINKNLSKEEQLEYINKIKDLVKVQINYINKKLKENKSSENYSYKRLVCNFETMSKNLFYKMQLLKAKG